MDTKPRIDIINWMSISLTSVDSNTVMASAYNSPLYALLKQQELTKFVVY